MVTEHEGLITAVKALAEAEQANKRLDRMNGSIDRMGTAIIEARSELGAKIDAILLSQATQLGESKARSGFLDSRRFVITTFIALGATVIALAAVILTH